MSGQRVSTEFICNQLGLPASKTNVQQLNVFFAALRKFNERDAQYGSAWVDAEPEEQAGLAASKARRARAILSNGDGEGSYDNLMDECIDGINYFAFLHRQVDGRTP